MTGVCVLEGPLSKWTNMMKGWQYRWFVLDDNVGLLSYYTSREKRMRGERRGCVRLQGAVIGIDDEDDSTFTLTVDQKTFHFQVLLNLAKHSDEKEQWINYLESVIMKVSQPRLQYYLGLAQNLGSPQSTSMADFDKKLVEADAYLKVLIDQIQDLQKRIILFSSSDEPLKDKFISLKTSAEVMVESIKQTIVFLQISKHNIMHISTSTGAPQISDQFTPAVTLKNCEKSSITTATSSTFNYFSATNETSANEVSTHRSAECLVDSYITETPQEPILDHHHHHNHHLLQPLSQVSHSALSNSLPNLLTPSEDFQDVSCHDAFPKVVTDLTLLEIPDESFSSSGDDDDRYYDADDDRYFDAEDETRPKEGNADKNKSSPKDIASNVNASYDDEDDDETEENLESMANHQSLFSHLFNQLHIGMDLTKVTLPTFILEKRSLLEMYSDFMSHPDLFISISDQATAKDRFVQTVKWYLSAFHAGKKSGVAKKPYNPILGECFKCFYELPQSTPLEATNEELVKDGPIPWCSKNNLSFVAEQVSHHPPTFYAECYNRRISINGYIWTKSKFLGLSVGVHMIGQAVISVLDHDEDYVVTFPNGYGRSILTVPWMELCGKVSITCSKTGFNAQIQFHSKPFYGGKKDQIVAELFARNDKKPFSTIKGEWSGSMFIKTGSQNELFLDTRGIPVTKKQVKPIDLQEANESRRLWRNVTYHLKTKDIERATEFKCELEQNQRDEAKARKELGVKFETKLFHEVGAHWVFDKPLVSRIVPSSTPTSKPEDLLAHSM